MAELRAVLRRDCPPEVAIALWHLEESRSWTLSYIEDTTQGVLDLRPDGHRHSLATLLYHIAVFEVDWLYTDLLANPYDMERRIPGCPPDLARLLQYPLLLEDGSYTPVAGESLKTHVDRLRVIRQDLVEVYTSMTPDEFRAPRTTEDGSLTAEWVAMHLARHESEHRGQIWEAREAARRQLGETA